MELLRRALLVGCLLPGIWLLRLAPLDPLLSVVPVDFAARQREEAASMPDERKTEAQRRMAQLPLSVYVEEVLQYNVFPATGPDWDAFLRGVDAAAGGARNGMAWRGSPERPKEGGALLYFGQDEEPLGAVHDRLAAGGGSTYVSFSRPGGDVHYRVERHAWTRRDFRPGPGFAGKPRPPASLLYPFRLLALGCLLAGLAFHALLSGPGRAGATRGRRALELAALAGGLVLFAAPLCAVGGSVQALTVAPVLAVACWIPAMAGIHVFAGPGRNAPDPVTAIPPGGARGRALFLREGLAFLAMALGPLAFLVAASMILWNR